MFHSIVQTTLRSALLAGACLLTAVRGADPDTLKDEGYIEFSPLRVYGGDDRYSTNNGNSADLMSLPMPLENTPIAISIINRDLMDDQAVRRLDDVLQNVAGVVPGGYYSEWDYFRIRGFDAAFSTYLDGLRGGVSMSAELFGLEQVEVVKGPVSPMVGEGPIGGLVNMVSKRPQPVNAGFVRLAGGSHGYGEAGVDYGFVMNESQSVYARLNILYRHQDTFSDFASKDRYFAAPAVTWEISDRTTVTLLGQYLRDEFVMAPPLPARGTVLPNINGPISRDVFLGDEGSNRVEGDSVLYGAEIIHRFNESWSSHHILRRNQHDQDWTRILYPSQLLEDQRTLLRYPYDYYSDARSFTMNHALKGHFRTGAIAHNLLVGANWFSGHTNSGNRQIDYRDPDAYMPVDIFAPEYGIPVSEMSDWNYHRSENNTLGFYFTDSIDLTDSLVLAVGGRFDRSESGDQDAEAFSPRAGATYKPARGLALYVNYSRSFAPQWDLFTAEQTVVDPERGNNYEAGVKASLLGDRIVGMFSVFRLERENIATADPLNPGFSTVSGEQRSRGFELEGVITPIPALQVTFAYAYMDVEVIEDNTLPIGTPTPNTPRHTVRLWGRYDITDGAAEGLGIGFGGRWYSEQSGDLQNTFELPAYGLLEAALYFRRGRFSAQVNFKNLLDEDYFTGSYSDLYVQPGNPREVIASASFEF